MLGNITLVQPLERLYNSTFQKQWDKTIDKIRLTSPSELEEMDILIRSLERYYELSGVKKISVALGTYPDEYANRIRSLKSDLCEVIARKFRTVEQQIGKLVGDPDSIDDFELERKRFDEAVALFRMLKAFYQRWKLQADDYHYAGERFEFPAALKDIAMKLARKRMHFMHEFRSMKKVVEYRKRIGVLDEISGEVSKLFDWYVSNYLNKDSKNPEWVGADGLPDDAPWMSVDFLDDDPGIAPLERFRKVPSGSELDDVRRLFERFVEFYRKHDLVDINELGVLADYVKFRDYSANFSLYSEDAEERLKAGLMEQLLKLHQVLRDATERINMKEHTEQLLQNSFAMYFAPVDEIYRILQNGFISSEDSIHHRFSGANYDNIIFRVDADIRDGDIGFIFPLTKVVDGHRFYQVSYNPLVKEGLSESNTSLHVFSRTHRPLKIDIRKGVFIAPRDKLVRYTDADGQVVRESSEQYFRRFFTALSQQGSEWFECDRLHNWMSRHCLFYDSSSRLELLNMLRNKGFVSVINMFTNRKYDNLSLAQLPGELKPSEFYVTHKFEQMPESMKEVLGSDSFNLSLFEWVKNEEE